MRSVDQHRHAIPRSLFGLFVVVLTTMAWARPASAQDLKPISSILAAQISASGHKTVAVVDFTDLAGNVTELGRFLAEEVSVNLVGAAKGYEVIDRTHLKAILQEHKLASTGLIDPQTARQLGQIAGVDALVTGTITPLGETIRLSAKVLDTATARMIAASATDIPKTPAIDVLMKQGIGGETGNSATSPGGAPNTSPSTSPAQVSVRQGDLLFTVRGCWRSVSTAQNRTSEALRMISYQQAPQGGGAAGARRGGYSQGSGGSTLNCSGFVTNKSVSRQQVSLTPGFTYPSAVDDLGNQYQIRDVVFGTSGTSQTLEPDLPVNFSLSLEDLDPGATRVNIILTPYSAGGGARGGGAAGAGGGSGTVALRNIVVQNR